MLREHPAGVEQRRAWFGVEAEGQHRGKRVAVIQAIPDDAFLARCTDVEHFFLTEDFREWEWVAARLIPLADKLGASIAVGVLPAEVEDVLRLPFASRLGIIVRVWVDDLSWCAHLRPADEVSVGKAFFMLTVRVDGAVLSVPGDYERDAP